MVALRTHSKGRKTFTEACGFSRNGTRCESNPLYARIASNVASLRVQVFGASRSMMFPLLWRRRSLAWFFAAACFITLSPVAPAQTLAKRLILKDGSYQLATKYEIHGDRVRYYSAERGEWEEVPNSMIDWDATEKYEQGRLHSAPSPEAVQLDKELEAEQKAFEARSPQVVPGLRLPEEGGIFLLDTYQNQPQLAELQQSGGELNRNTKSNILRAAINPLASARQTIELPGDHAKIQSHAAVPSIYANLDAGQGATGAAPAASAEPPPLPPAERFKIIRVEAKGGKRIAGAVKIAVTGKMKTDERFVAATVTPMTGGWAKITPTEPLPPASTPSPRCWARKE